MTHLAPKTIHEANDIVAAAEMQREKLIEASLEEILPETSYPAASSAKGRLWPRYLLAGAIPLLFIIGGALYFFPGEDQSRSVPSLPLSTRVNDYEITVSSLDDLSELSAVIGKYDQDNADFLELTVNSRHHCVPDAFATLPHNMISLLDRKGGAKLVKPMEGLQKTTRTISKMNTCGRDSAVVFIRTIVALDRQNHYSGLSISGLQNTGPLTITWDSR